MLARARLFQARVLPKGWADVLRQMSLFAAAFLCYRLVRGLVEGRGTAAFQHARDVISVERTLHFFVEPSVQGWASGSHAVMTVASWMYVNAQTSVTVGALLYLYLCHNRSFYFVRNMFLIAMGVALLGYYAFPTAPPRFLPEWGFVDTVSDFTGIKVSHTSAFNSAVFNPYAAVPSMHVAFALMVSWPISRLARTRAVRIAWRLYPLLITFVIVVTANHFLSDAVLGAMTAAGAAYGALWMARWRPAVWRFVPAGPPPFAPAGAPGLALEAQHAGATSG